MTLFEAQTGGAFDRLNWQHSGEFDQNFSKKSNAPEFARGGMGRFGIDRYIRAREIWRSWRKRSSIPYFFLSLLDGSLLGKELKKPSTRSTKKMTK